MATLARVVQFAAPKGHEVVGLMFLSKRHKSTNITHSNYKRGTGGRSSFNGNVVTVFGAKSCLGFHLVNDLAKIGTQVICPYRGDPDYLRDMKLMGDLGQILFCEIDLRDEESLKRAMKYSKVVINLIGKQYETRNWSFDEVHVEGARRLARCAREVGIEKFIHMSALNAGKQSSNVLSGGSKFLQSKYEGEQAVREEFPEATIIRPADMIDVNDYFSNTLTSKARMHWSPDIGMLGQIYGPLRMVNVWKYGLKTVKMPVRADDVAKSLVNAVDDPNVYGKTYQIVGPYAYYLFDLVEVFLNSKSITCNIGTLDFRDKLYAKLREKVYMTMGVPRPKVTCDVIERESLTDSLDPALLTTEDLGITPRSVVELLRHVYKPARRTHYGHHLVIPKDIGEVNPIFSTLKGKT